MALLFVAVFAIGFVALIAGVPETHSASRLFGLPSTVAIFAVLCSIVSGVVLLVLHLVNAARSRKKASPLAGQVNTARPATGQWLMSGALVAVVLTAGTALSYWSSSAGS